jgi:hypothetical protein
MFTLAIVRQQQFHKGGAFIRCGQDYGPGKVSAASDNELDKSDRSYRFTKRDLMVAAVGLNICGVQSFD